MAIGDLGNRPQRNLAEMPICSSPNRSLNSPMNTKWRGTAHSSARDTKIGKTEDWVADRKGCKPAECATTGSQKCSERLQPLRRLRSSYCPLAKCNWDHANCNDLHRLNTRCNITGEVSLTSPETAILNRDLGKWPQRNRPNFP